MQEACLGEGGIFLSGNRSGVVESTRRSVTRQMLNIHTLMAWIATTSGQTTNPSYTHVEDSALNLYFRGLPIYMAGLQWAEL